MGWQDGAVCETVTGSVKGWVKLAPRDGMGMGTDSTADMGWGTGVEVTPDCCDQGVEGLGQY